MKDCDSKNAIAYIDAYLVKGSWTESGITWNNKPDYYANEKLGALIYKENESVVTDNQFYITKAVQAWIQGVPNYGIMIMENDDGTYRRFSSTEGDDIPYLVITYSDDALTITPGISSGESYFIVNKKTEKYVEAAGAVSGSAVYQYSGNGLTNQTWIITRLGTGYYSIKLSGTSMYLVSSATSSTTVRLGAYSGNYGQWQIVRNWNGSYRIYNRAYPSRVLYLSSTSTEDNATIYLSTYTHNYLFNDEWSIVRVARGEASVFCFDYSIYDPDTQVTTRFDTTTGTNLLSSFLGEYSTQVYLNQTATSGFNKHKTSPIYILTSHGAPSTMCFYQSNGSQTTIGTRSSYHTYGIDALSENALAHQQLMLIQTCRTGCDDTNSATNLVGQSYRLGSHNLISNTCITTIGPDRTWLLSFIMNMNVGRSIGYAKERADETIIEQFGGDAGGVPQRHDLGDESVYLLSYPLPTATASSDSAVVQNNYQGINSFAELQTLQKVKTTEVDAFGNAYDIYLDSNGGLYNFYANTDSLQSYLPNNSRLNLGTAVVNKEKAFAKAKEILNDMGYDVSGFTCESSNEYSKTYRIAYKYLFNGSETSEKIVLYMKADENGDVHLVNLMAFDYGMFSSDANSVSKQTSIALTDVQAETELCERYGDAEIQRIYWTRNSTGSIVQQAVVTVETNGTRITKVVDM